ncbi:hypothetical protein WKH43_13600 [Pantoea agglomerans]|uniref:hypothetical protein n=1 Tax=Enterobacter agglomerans TaxID=549 RepID=UPI003C79DB1A
MIDYGTTVNVKTKSGTYDLGVIRSAKFTVMSIGKSIEIVVMDNPVGNITAAELVKAVGEENSMLSIINESNREDYTVRLTGVNFDGGGISISAIF